MNIHDKKTLKKALIHWLDFADYDNVYNPIEGNYSGDKADTIVKLIESHIKDVMKKRLKSLDKQ